MKFVKIFIASSITEFEQTRIFIGDYIRKFNEKSWDKGFQIKLFLCEDEFQNSQPVYDRQILKSDIFITIIGQALGEFTKHEIVDVAYSCESIKEKIIILTKTESSRYLYADLAAEFRCLTFDHDLLAQIESEILAAASRVLFEIEDEPTISLTNENFYLNIPSAQSIECAVLGNIIRRLRDQGNGIILSEFKKNDAYVALLSNDYRNEIKRVINCINEGVPVDLLWIFANNALWTNNELDTTKMLNELSCRLGGKYFDTYQSYQTLSVVFENKLLGALIRRNLLDGSAFIYIIQDHWLVRKGNKSGNNCINLLSTGYAPDSEEQSRKERVIVNLLNYYWLQGKTDKHIKALEALQQSNYEYFAYSEEDLEEMSLKRSEYKQAIIDFIFGKLENILLNTSDLEGREVLRYIKQLLQLPKVEGVLLSPENAFSIYLFAYGILSFYHSLLQEAYQLLKECWANYQKISDPMPKFKASGKLCILQLCQISNELSLVREELEWLSIADTFYDDNDEWYKANVLLRKKSVFVNRDAEIEKLCDDKLCSIFQQDFIAKNNSNLNLFLQYRYSCIWKDFNNIDQYKEEIMVLLNKYYTPFLSNDNNYMQTGICLLSLCALSGANQEKNLELCDDIIKHYIDNRKDNDREIEYYNLLFTRATILRKLSYMQKSLELFKTLSELYRGNRDKGICYQNIALCYMNNYNDIEALVIAESYYLRALDCFMEVRDKYMEGNTYDGLSYCYLLQNKYEDANLYASKALTNNEYETPNKYANFISSLLCLNKYSEAVEFYIQQKNKGKILEQISKDFYREIMELNICVEIFRRFIAEVACKA